jgi:hypothetical protein
MIIFSAQRRSNKPWNAGLEVLIFDGVTTFFDNLATGSGNFSLFGPVSGVADGEGRVYPSG